MEDDLSTDTPCRISYLRQRRSGVDKSCQSWPVRTYKILVYKLISQAIAGQELFFLYKISYICMILHT